MERNDLAIIQGGLVNSDNNNGIPVATQNPLNLESVLGTIPVVGTLPRDFDFDFSLGLPPVDLSGVILDEARNPLPQAHVYLEDNPSVGVFTDFNGRYDLGEVDQIATVVVSHASHPTKTFFANTMPDAVQMAGSNQLDAVIINADPTPAVPVKSNTIVYVVVAILVAATIALFATGPKPLPKAVTV